MTAVRRQASVTMSSDPTMLCRVCALFYADKISIEPLTESMCLINRLASQPKKLELEFMQRMLQALALGIEELAIISSEVSHQFWPAPCSSDHLCLLKMI